MEARALIAAVVAFGIAAGLTPVFAKLATYVGATNRLSDRGLARKITPLFGGLAIFVAVVVISPIFIPVTLRLVAILIAASIVVIVGVIDDMRDLHAGWKLAGQTLAGLVCVLAGVRVEHFTLPFIHHVDLGLLGGPLTLFGLVAIMNVVNFSDGADGLAAGVCAIAAAALAIIAFDLNKDAAGTLAAVVCGASIGFLLHNFHPASVFMGDSGSNLLGLLLGVVMVEGSVKTNALVALIVPLVVLAVPVLDTSFVIAKRLKYRRPVHQADANHFHHRFHRIGFSQRKTVFYLYAWTLITAGLAVAMRFIPYSDSNGHFKLTGSIVMGGCFLIAFAASVYLIYLLEIVKLRGMRASQLRTLDPQTSEHEIDERVEYELETGEFILTSERHEDTREHEEISI